MVHVTTDAVRRRLKLSEEDIGDEDVMAFIQDAAAWISEQIGETLDHENCCQSEHDAIANLAAIYSYCHTTGGTFTGTEFTLGDLHVKEHAQDLTAQLNFLKQQVERFIGCRENKPFGIVVSEGA
jgi:hypothetical protein